MSCLFITLNCNQTINENCFQMFTNCPFCPFMNVSKCLQTIRFIRFIRFIYVCILIFIFDTVYVNIYVLL